MKSETRFNIALLTIELIKYLTLLVIAYLLIWCLIIEPFLPQHYYGVSDLIEAIVMVALVFPVLWINSLIGFFNSSRFFTYISSLKVSAAISSLKKFGRKYRLNKTIVFDEKYVEFAQNKNSIYLILGITTGVKLSKAYCYGWSFNENGKDIDLYELIYTKLKPIYHKFKTVPLGSECVFDLQYRDYIQIKWKVHIKEDEELTVILDDESMTPNPSRWGFNLDYFTNSALKDRDKEISTFKIKTEANSSLFL